MDTINPMEFQKTLKKLLINQSQWQEKHKIKDNKS